MEPWPIVGRDRELLALETVLRRGDSAVVLGAAGTGKTRLVQHLLERDRRPTVSVAGTSAARHVPLGAFGPVLRADLPGAAFDRLQAARAWIADATTLLVVDDAHLLDPLSAALVLQLIAARPVSVVATARSDVACDPAVAELWVGGRTERIALAPLERSRTSALLRAVLGGPVTPSTEREIWDRTRGNALALRELVTTTLEVGALAEVDGVWRLDADIALPRETAEVIAARLATLDGPERDAFELVALGDPLPLAALVAAGSATACEALERRGLVHVVERADGPWVRPHHPLHGEAIRAAVKPLRRARHERTLARIAPHLTDLDPLRAARWQLEASIEPDHDLLRRAALAARGADPPLHRRLAEALVARAPNASNLCLAAQAAASTGHGADALRLLEQAEAAATDDRDREEIAATAIDWAGALDEVAEDASQLARRLADAISDPDAAARVATTFATAAALSGRRDEVLRAVERILAADDVTPTTVLAAATERSVFGLFSGRTDALDEEFDRLAELALQVGDVTTTPMIEAGRSTWYCLVGRLPDAIDQDRRTLAAAIESGDVRRRWMASIWLAVALELSGALDEALAVLADLQPLLSLTEPAALRHFHPALSATVHLQRGTAGPARRLLASLPATARDDVRVHALAGRAEAWSAGLDGDLDQVARRAGELGEELRDAGWAVFAGLCLFDAVRLGRPGAVAGPLTELAAAADPSTELLHAHAAHARAAHEGDAQALDAVAVRWARAGAYLVAAEAGGAAATRHALDGRPDLAARAALRATGWLQRCGAAATPGLLGWRSPLTPREREVAGAAASGRTSPQIAARLVLSVRTVDNHLANTYRKLGITSRTELADVLGPGAWDPDSEGRG
ncbi:MAG: hypothetical protein JJT89_00680 [Nitriliruptoraceae bacterium]|nr:hypothetical protein [Nitriliruptoraceae bacterium]